MVNTLLFWLVVVLDFKLALSYPVSDGELAATKLSTKSTTKNATHLMSEILPHN